MPFLVDKLHSFGIKVILDIDDYWEVSREHPLYHAVKKDNLKDKIVGNLKIVDGVSTTTSVYKNYIKPYNKNILVIPNGVNRNLKEWIPANDKCSYDKMRILYLAGSSHLQDVSLLKDSFERLVSDTSLTDKFQVHLSGFDLRGTTTNYIVNEEFIKEMQSMGLFNEHVYKKLVANNFDIVNTPEIPRELVQKYNGKVLDEQTRPINPQETVWTRYEEIFTSNYKLIKDKDYYDFLMKFDLDAVYEKQSEQNYFRHKTQGLYKFAANYKHGDVALAPIKVYGKGVMDDNSDNRYQFAKSNLKGENNPFWGRSHSSETKEQIARSQRENRQNSTIEGFALNIKGIIYPSISEASRQTNHSRDTIRRWLNDPNNSDCVAVDASKPQKSGNTNTGNSNSVDPLVANRGIAKKISLYGEIYDSITSAAKKRNCTRVIIQRLLRNHPDKCFIINPSEVVRVDDEADSV
jgi:hypothetical protein